MSTEFNPTKFLYNTFNSNRATIEKWLAYPRQLQQEYGVNPVLAGGAMRDIILGAEPTDIDIFISMSDARMHGANLDTFIHELGCREGWSLQHTNEPQATASWVPELHSVWTFQSEFVDKPYNFIFLPEDTSAAQVINRFDFGINMIATNTYSILTVNKFFIEDMKHQKCTVVNERSLAVREQRYARLLQKYPALVLMSKEGLELDKPHQGLILPPGM